MYSNIIDVNDRHTGGAHRRKGGQMYEVAWQEFNKSDRLVTKRRSFKTEAARDRFIEKLYNKDNFYAVVGTR